MADLAHTNVESDSTDDTPLAHSFARVSPSEWLMQYREHLPTMLDGATFLLHCGDTIDLMTPINVEQTYLMRQVTEPAIYEQYRPNYSSHFCNTPHTPPNTPH